MNGLEDMDGGCFAVDIGPLLEACHHISRLPMTVQGTIVRSVVDNVHPTVKALALVALLQEIIEDSNDEKFDPKTMLPMVELSGELLEQYEMMLRIKHTAVPPTAEALSKLVLKCSSANNDLMEKVGIMCNKVVVAKYGEPKDCIAFNVLDVNGKPTVCIKKDQLEAAIGKPVDDEDRAMKRYSLN